MEKKISNILSLYESILNTKLINEVSSTSTSLLGGKSFNIPGDGAHRGQSGWQSANAWDIGAPVGTPVYAIVGGTVKTYNDYGPTPIKKNGKTLFGAGFTVDSEKNLPDVYYTHLSNTTVKQGDKIKCGQLIGYVMDFPGSDFDHVHIGVESGNIRQFLNNTGSITCGEGAEENSPLSTDPETEEETPSEEGGFLSSYAKNIAKSIMGTNSKGEDNTIDIGKDISKLIGLTENINRIKELLK